MKYRFENNYTKAEGIKWQMQASANVGSGNMSKTSAYLVFIIQFGLFAPIVYGILTLDLPFVLTASLLFFSFYLIGVFYDGVIYPHVAARFDKTVSLNADGTSHATIDIDEEEIRTREGEQETIFKWTGIRSVEDDEKTIFLLTEKGYCAIPARCFADFLEKDAFVRACRAKISGQTEQGAYFA